MPTCTCGKTVDDWRGARGHVQFTDDEQHGGEGVPDDWRDLFDEDGDEPEADESDEEADADEGADEDVPDTTEPEESHSDQSDASESNGGIRQVLTTPLDELLGL